MICSCETRSVTHADHSIVLARWHQCAPHLVHLIGIHTVPVLPPAESLWVHQPSDVSGMSWFSLFLPSKLLCIWRSGPHLIHGSLGQLKSTSQMASRLVQPFLQAQGQCRPTVTPCYSVCSNRLHLASAVMQPNSLCRSLLTDHSFGTIVVIATLNISHSLKASVIVLLLDIRMVLLLKVIRWH